MKIFLPKFCLLAFCFSALFYLCAQFFIAYPLTTILKPLPILSLALGVMGFTGLKAWVKTLILLSLIYSMIGDIVLSIPLSHALEMGIGAFFLAHVCYICLFFAAYQHRPLRWFAFLPVLGVMGWVALLVLPRVGELLIPVLIYLLALLVLAFSAMQVRAQALQLGIGAVLFLFSDSLLAIQLFVYPQLPLHFLVMLTYYLAQGLLISGLLGLYRGHDFA